MIGRKVSIRSFNQKENQHLTQQWFSIAEMWNTQMFKNLLLIKKYFWINIYTFFFHCKLSANNSFNWTNLQHLTSCVLLKGRRAFYKITKGMYFLPSQCISIETAGYPDIWYMEHSLPQWLPVYLTLSGDQDWKENSDKWRGKKIPSIQTVREVTTIADGSVWPQQTTVHLCRCRAAGGSMNLN